MSVKVVITGGGEKTLILVKDLTIVEGIEIVGVCDIARSSSVIKYAKTSGIFASQDLSEVIKNTKPDLVIESSGSKDMLKALQKVLPRTTKVIDAVTARILLSIIGDESNGESNSRLEFVEKMTRTFAEGFDSHNIIYPSFEIFRSSFGLHAFALLIAGEDEDELLIVGECDIKEECLDKLKVRITEELNSAGYATDPKKIKAYGQWRSDDKKPCKLKRASVYPLKSGSKVEGAIALAFTTEGNISSTDENVLQAVASEFALFITNERIKRDLADSKARLESMLNGMSEGVVALDPDFNIVLVNPSAREILDVRDLRVGRQFMDAIDDPEIVKLGDLMKKENKALFHEAHLNTSVGEKIIRFIGAPIGSTVGKPAGWVILIADVTKEKAMDRMKSEFISTTSHELRTPLAAIKESISLIFDGTTGDVNEQQRRFLDLARRNIERLAALINDLLDLSKLEAGRMEIKIRPCDFSELIVEAMEPMQFLAREKGIKLSHAIDEALPVVRCDPDRITQIIVNLIGNAVKFTPKEGSVTLAVRCVENPSLYEMSDGKLPLEMEEFAKTLPHVGRSVLVSISDTGAGIDKKDFSKLFTKFGQLDSSLTRRPGGTGLGLSICKELVRLHGGIIWAESSIGNGSTFLFSIPVE